MRVFCFLILVIYERFLKATMVPFFYKKYYASISEIQILAIFKI